LNSQHSISLNFDLSVGLVAFVNAFSAKVSSQVQIVFTVAKLLACALVIGIGIYQLIIGEFGTLPTNGFDKGKVTAGSLALAFYQGLWSYDGKLTFPAGRYYENYQLHL